MLISRETFSGPVRNLHPASKGNFALSILQNRSHEDFFCLAQLGNDCQYYAVFDGHGGGNKNGTALHDYHCVLYLKDYLHYHLAKALAGIPFDAEEEIRKAVVAVFREVDTHLYRENAQNGSTCSIALVTPVNVIFINLGDSQAIKVEEISSKPVLTFSTHVHNTSAEEERIQQAGGFIENGRLNGIFLPSRAFGDYEAKIVNKTYKFDGPMSAVPDVFFLNKKAGIVILGTDGLFDAFPQTEGILEIVGQAKSLRRLPEILVEYAKTRNANDDISCIVVLI